MAYLTPTAAYANPNRAITLYTTPTDKQVSLLRSKTRIDVFAHWAVCIQGVCYELTTADPAKSSAKYGINWMPEQQWIQSRQNKGLECKPTSVGNTKRLYSEHQMMDIATQVWRESLKEKYQYAEQNCQLFVRLLLELVGDAQAIAFTLPQSFHIWVKTAGISQNFSAMALMAGFSAMATSAAATPVDPTGTAFVALAVSSSVVVSTSLNALAHRRRKERAIVKGQGNVRTIVNAKWGEII